MRKTLRSFKKTCIYHLKQHSLTSWPNVCYKQIEYLQGKYVLTWIIWTVQNRKWKTKTYCLWEPDFMHDTYRHPSFDSFLQYWWTELIIDTHLYAPTRSTNCIQIRIVHSVADGPIIEYISRNMELVCTLLYFFTPNLPISFMSYNSQVLFFLHSTLSKDYHIFHCHKLLNSSQSAKWSWRMLLNGSQ